MHIVIADLLPASAVEILRNVPGWTVDARAGRPAADLIRDIAAADALVVRSATTVDAAVIAAAPHLRAIARAGTGVDNVDVTAATARGIVVMNAPGANSVSVAEHALALMLALSRAIPAADAAMKRNVWDKKRLTGAELRGKTLGIIGLGRIGQVVAEKARHFGMTIAYYNPSVRVAPAYESMSLDQLLATSDVISLHVPLLPQTRHLIDRKALSRMKRSAYLINTSRGPVVDEEALAWALREGIIKGAGLDVYEDEPKVHPGLLALDNVVLVPHMASATAETRAAMYDLVARNVVNVLSGRPPVTPIP